jgi:hypothetical protein
VSLATPSPHPNPRYYGGGRRPKSDEGRFFLAGGSGRGTYGPSSFETTCGCFRGEEFATGGRGGRGERPEVSALSSSSTGANNKGSSSSVGNIAIKSAAVTYCAHRPHIDPSTA